jgi:hypothetical protein
MQDKIVTVSCKQFPHSRLMSSSTLSIVRYSKKHNVSETGSVSVLMWKGQLDGAKINHWTTYISIITTKYAPRIRFCQREIKENQ